MNETNNSDMKNYLADALKKISKTKKLEKISVGDIVKMSGVNRSTFYYHFIDKDDLIQYIFEYDVTRWYVPPEHGGKWIQNTQRLLQILHRDRLFYLQALKIDSENNFRNIFLKITKKNSAYFTDHYLSGRELDKESKEFIINFYAYAFVEMNIAYIRDGARTPPERMVLRFFDVIEPGMQYAIDNCMKRYEKEKDK